MPEPAKEKKSSLRPLLAHAVRHWRSYLAGIVTLATVDFVNAIVLPWLQSRPFEDVKAGVTAETLGWVAVEYLGLTVVQLVLRYFWRYFFMGAAERIGYEVREQFFAKLQRLPIAFFDRAKTGDLMSRATNDLEAIRNALGLGALLAFDSLSYFLMVPVLLFWISPWLACVLACCLPVVTIATYKLGQIAHRRSAVVQDVFGSLSARLQENFSGIRVVQSFAQEDREGDRLARVGRTYQDAQLSLARVQAAFHPLLEWLFDVIAAIVLLFGAREVLAGRLELASLVRFMQTLNQIIWPMMALGWLMNVLQRGAAAHDRVEEILKQADDPTFQQGERVPATPSLRGAVEARALTFGYPAATRDRPPALVDVSFSVPAGAFVAVVGPIGSGKSTLLSLLARLYDPPRGQVFVDGQDLLDVPIASLRRAVALVPQETFLFSATIEENVKLGRTGELTREQVEAATRATQVEDEIRSLPGGYQALLGERGVNLSGGQRQRIAIARALVRAPRLLLLDDALSAVDTATETAIDAQIRAASSDGTPPTRIVATHRLAAARVADLVLVLEAGRLVERGTHAELVARDGLYARLARRDALAEELARA